ncbi:unnamed protein product [Polarella glacialis]|uniref:Kinesin-like protein n=1 Tax=Polarella glacialis TaxID=89957 RepID=A0A813LRA1_POLGL|nr:unnamed protein product [Polarella glacialis]CAE8713932.1 unnamed protein product [Polarella glacialis]CAE8735456.1 unnamed protein product [Polarella glacialis]
MEGEAAASGEDPGVEAETDTAVLPSDDTSYDFRARRAADTLLHGAQLRVECAKVCAATQFAELLAQSHAVLSRVRRIQSPAALQRLLPSAEAEEEALQAQWRQRSGAIRVVVRVRPPMQQPGEVAASCEGTTEEPQAEKPVAEEPAIRLCSGGVSASAPRGQGPALSISVRSSASRAPEVHRFRRFDRILGAEADQLGVFKELRSALPQGGPGSLTGPPQAACILAYGQTGAGKTHTMHGFDSPDGSGQGLVPRAMAEIFQLANAEQAIVSLSAIEVYNDIAYDLLAGGPARGSHAVAGRAFQAGRVPPTQGLDFRHGTASALEQIASVTVATPEEARGVLAQAEQRRSTRSTAFNHSSSRSHSLVFVQLSLPGNCEADPAGVTPALRLALVDLAGSERLPPGEVSQAAEESRHINLSLSALGSVIHALQHRAAHLPFRTCLLTRLLEPFFAAGGRVTLCVCVGPEQRHAQESLCSLAFADRASRALLGADSASEAIRARSLEELRGASAWLRSALAQLLPWAAASSSSGGPRRRLPDGVATIVLRFMPRHGHPAVVCKAWAAFCRSHARWGHMLRTNLTLAESVLKWLSTGSVAASFACRVWWQAAGARRVVLNAATASVQEATCDGSLPWAAARASVRASVWKALMSSGSDRATGPAPSSEEPPLFFVRELSLVGSSQPEAVRDAVSRCSALRVAEVTASEAVAQAALRGLAACKQLRALRCLRGALEGSCLRDMLESCRHLQVLYLSASESGSGPVHCQSFMLLKPLAEALPRNCSLKELTVERCLASYDDFRLIAQSCLRMRRLCLPFALVDPGVAETALLPLLKLRQLRLVDFRTAPGKIRDQRPWLSEEMLAVLNGLPSVCQLRVSNQRLFNEQRLWLLHKHGSRLSVLHLDGCRAMLGDKVFSLLHRCSRLESLRLPQLLVEPSEEQPGSRSARWCRGLQCLWLRELSVDGWDSLEDAGVQALASQCPKLRSVVFRSAQRLGDDAVAYLAALRELRELVICRSGVTDRALVLVQASRLKSLDLSGCHQLTGDGVEGLARALLGGPVETEPTEERQAQQAPPLQHLRLEGCPRIGRGAARALLSVAASGCGLLTRVSLRNCRLLPESAQHWDDPRSHDQACAALRSAALASSEDPEVSEEGPSANVCFKDMCHARGKRPEGKENADSLSELEQAAPVCSICLSEISAQEAIWTCPVCACKLHYDEQCALEWLRSKQSCPQCRAVWVFASSASSVTSAARRRFSRGTGSSHRSASADTADARVLSAPPHAANFGVAGVGGVVHPGRRPPLPRSPAAAAPMQPPGPSFEPPARRPPLAAGASLVVASVRNVVGTNTTNNNYNNNNNTNNNNNNNNNNNTARAGLTRPRPPGGVWPRLRPPGLGSGRPPFFGEPVSSNSNNHNNNHHNHSNNNSNHQNHSNNSSNSSSNSSSNTPKPKLFGEAGPRPGRSRSVPTSRSREASSFGLSLVGMSIVSRADLASLAHRPASLAR